MLQFKNNEFYEKELDYQLYCHENIYQSQSQFAPEPGSTILRAFAFETHQIILTRHSMLGRITAVVQVGQKVHRSVVLNEKDARQAFYILDQNILITVELRDGVIPCVYFYPEAAGENRVEQPATYLESLLPDSISLKKATVLIFPSQQELKLDFSGNVLAVAGEKFICIQVEGQNAKVLHQMSASIPINGLWLRSCGDLTTLVLQSGEKLLIGQIVPVAENAAQELVYLDYEPEQAFELVDMGTQVTRQNLLYSDAAMFYCRVVLCMKRPKQEKVFVLSRELFEKGSFQLLITVGGIVRLLQFGSKTFVDLGTIALIKQDVVSWVALSSDFLHVLYRNDECGWMLNSYLLPYDTTRPTSECKYCRALQKQGLLDYREIILQLYRQQVRRFKETGRDDTTISKKLVETVEKSLRQLQFIKVFMLSICPEQKPEYLQVTGAGSVLISLLTLEGFQQCRILEIQSLKDTVSAIVNASKTADRNLKSIALAKQKTCLLQKAAVNFALVRFAADLDLPRDELFRAGVAAFSELNYAPELRGFFAGKLLAKQGGSGAEVKMQDQLDAAALDFLSFGSCGLGALIEVSEPEFSGLFRALKVTQAELLQFGKILGQLCPENVFTWPAGETGKKLQEMNALEQFLERGSLNLHGGEPAAAITAIWGLYCALCYYLDACAHFCAEALDGGAHVEECIKLVEYIAQLRPQRTYDIVFENAAFPFSQDFRKALSERQLSAIKEVLRSIESAKNIQQYARYGASYLRMVFSEGEERALLLRDVCKDMKRALKAFGAYKLDSLPQIRRDVFAGLCERHMDVATEVILAIWSRDGVHVPDDKALVGPAFEQALLEIAKRDIKHYEALQALLYQNRERADETPVRVPVKEAQNKTIQKAMDALRMNQRDRQALLLNLALGLGEQIVAGVLSHYSVSEEQQQLFGLLQNFKQAPRPRGAASE